MEKLTNEMKDRIILFVKFGQKKHLEDLQKGKLYMNNFQYFSDLEKERNLKGMGDEYEGALVMQNIDVTLTPYDNKAQSINFSANNMKLTRDGAMSKPVFCITSLSIEDLKNISTDNKKIIGTLEFTEEQKEKIEREFGSYALLISPGHFLNKIDEKLNNEGIAYIDDKVKYSDYDVNYINRIESCISKSTNVFFWKDLSLSYQKEYRIVILNRDSDKPFICNIGNMTQFTKLVTTKEFLNEKYKGTINYE